MSTIKQGESKFYIGDDEASPQAEIDYRQGEGNNLIVDHTYVADELRGQGIAGKLVEKMVNHARKEGKKIVPECTYAKSKMENTPAYHDVLAD